MNRFLQVLLVVFFPILAYSQEPYLSQPFSTPLLLNPGYAGAEGCSRAVVAFRGQNIGRDYQYLRAHLSYDQYVPLLKAGVGLSLIQRYEMEDLQRTTQLSYVHSQHFQIGESFVISPAFEFIFRHRSLDNRFAGYRDINVFDLNTGVLFYSRNIQAGFAVYRLGFPRETYYPNINQPVELATRAHFAINFGTEDEKFSVSPNLSFFDDLEFQMLLLGITFSYGRFSVGASFSDIDAVIFQGKLHWKELMVGYSYDLNTQSFYFIDYFAHELTISHRFNCKNKRGAFMHPRKKAI